MDRVRLDCETYRIIPSKYPPISLFEFCLDPQDLEAAYELEALTNDRLQDEAGILSLVPEEDRIAGPGTSVIMASFTHAAMQSRFTDGSYGIYYAGLDRQTAIEETRHWQAKQILDSSEPPFVRVMRVYVACVDPHAGAIVDLRADQSAHNPDSYQYPQALGRELREQSEYGVLYQSIRNPGGECLAAFKATLMKPAIQSVHLQYHWNGKEIFHIDEVKDA